VSFTESVKFAAGFDTSYNRPVSRDIASLARSLGGRLVAGVLDTGTPVDGVVRLSGFSLVGHASFATLVVASAPEIAAVFGGDDPRADALRSAVVVTHGDDHALLALLEEAGVTAVVGTAEPEEVLLPALTALLAVDQAAEDRAVTSAMKVLTLAARRGGVSGVVAELAHRIDGWAVLLDRHGQVITTAGAGGLHVQDAVAVALGRPVRVRHRSLQVHAVGPGEDLSAQLIVSPRTESSSRARELGSQTAALLDLVLRTDDPTRTERLGRGVLMEVLLAGGEPAASLLRRWGVHETTLTAFALTARSASVDVERLVSLWLNELGAAHVLTQSQGVVTGFLRDDHVDEVGARVEAYSSALFLGVGVSAPTDALASSASEAAQALEAARAEGRRVVHYSSIPTIAFVLDRLPEADNRRLARLLDPLRDPAGVHGDLLETLRVFLAENGAWGAAADRLGIHRQTLATRVQRIEALVGLSLADADDRTAAWLALRAVRG
jgi:PucR family transcriptional regulator, purine catabolism regulatory protein